MLIYIIKKSGLEIFTLPSKISGSYWIKETKDNGKYRDLINIKEQDGRWLATSNKKVQIIVSGKKIDSCYIGEYQFILLQFNNINESVYIYTCPINDQSFKKLKYNKNEEIFVGSDGSNSISYRNPLVSPKQVRIYYQDNILMIEDLDSKYGTFVNNKPIVGKNRLYYGDIIFVMGFKLMVLNGCIYLNNPLDSVGIDSNMFQIVKPVLNNNKIEFSESDDELVLYNESDYFVKSPRFLEKIDDKEFLIEAPPSIGEEDNTPLWLTMGPMVTMGMTSMIYVYSSVVQIQQGQSIVSTLPMLAMSVSMLGGTLLWPTLSNSFNKKQRKKKVEKRNKKYGAYLYQKEADLKAIISNQRQILLANYLNSSDCYQIVINKNRYLWTREPNQDSFLEVRLGLGTIPVKLKINYPQEHFTLDDDDLEKKMQLVVKNNRDIVGAPIVLSLVKKNILAITGNYLVVKRYMDNLLLQILALHSYFDLKIIIFTNEENKSGWEYLGKVPHLWSNDREVRFFSVNNEEEQVVSQYLDKIVNSRIDSNKNGRDRDSLHKGYDTYYLIITDDLKSIRDLTSIKSILENSDINLGNSLMILHPNLTNLPSECKAFISLESAVDGVVLESELSKESQVVFKVEDVNNIDFNYFSYNLANIPMQNENENYNFPKMLGFLEMYNAGLIEQLNPLEKWQNSNPIMSLAAPVGVDENGNIFKLDLHEKQHGPHGLIAGMTGSGKSEFIITYILSMAVNYHPDYVQFVLIDYKGGGLVGAFENKDTGVKLPHLAGTITNLDVADINRALASIESELKRRQRLFNQARDKLGEGTIDIYKYQNYYRDGMLDKPISHLFIISDEFAELKDQQPDFMDQLISTARIGRSLGVHLILATQKPSGVVNDQIWSNSRFRVCLKVQDESDSNEMLKKPDAASLKNVGRFYLQVGYDELFQLGQAAWAGSKYIPKEKVAKKLDDSISFIDDIGRNIKSINTPKLENTKALGEELPNIVKYLNNLAIKEGIKVNQLWLEKLPSVIYVDKLRKKYNYVHKPFYIDPIIGEYDNPKGQSQGVLKLDFTTGGNAVVYSSGDKSGFVKTMVYSLITTNRVDEVNIYILDLDTETLKIYQNAPQVGDVVLSADEDKIKNLMKLLDGEILKRKKLFQNYNGSYQFYCSNSGSTLPAMVVVIAGYENFKESYEDEEEIFARISRDCSKYGIYCLVTAINDRAMRLNTRSNFPTMLPLKIIGGTTEYNMLLGKKCPTIADVDGRGVAMINEEPYEFQTASVCDSTSFNDYILKVCNSLSSQLSGKAPSIPILPEKVTISTIINNLNGLSNVPIGIEDESLNVSLFDFRKQFACMINSESSEPLASFSSLLIEEMANINNLDIMVIDCDSLYSEYKFPVNIGYFSDNYIDTLTKLVENNNEKIVFITGISDFVEGLSSDIKNKMDSILSNLQKQKKCYFVIVSTLVNVKELAYESWFKKYVSLDNGIWIGKGLGNSTMHNLSTSYRILNLPISSNYGYNITDGEAISIKVLEKGGDVDGE